MKLKKYNILVWLNKIYDLNLLIELKSKILTTERALTSRWPVAQTISVSFCVTLGQFYTKSVISDTHILLN